MELIDNKGNRNQSYPIITQTKPEIVALIDAVNQDSLEAHIRYMQGFIRKADAPAALIVQNWLIDHFESYGYEDISIHNFRWDLYQYDFEAGNVVVVKKGTEFPDEYILITSHYDHPDGPGADDNASGTSGVLECARLLKDFPTKRSIMFIPFNAEEYWMVGSLPFAKKCAAEKMNIIAHFNMDMLGWFPPDNPNTIMASGYSDISKALFEYYQQTANTYVTTIPTICLSAGDSYGGDHMPFNMYEYPSLYIGDIEYHSQHPCYHKSCDTIGPFQVGVKCGVNRLDLVRAFAQSVLASAAELANAWLPPQNLSACSGIDNITVSWDNDSESSSYKIYRNDMFLEETTDHFYIDHNVVKGSKYEYYVIAVHATTAQESAPSNKDKVTFVTPLQLPYFNDFSVNKYGFEQSDWVMRNMVNKPSLCNTAKNDKVPDNYLSIAELDWFSIPEDVKNITIHFKWGGNLIGIWYNTGMFFEVTNDRKTWHKLAYLTGNIPTWKNYEISLNEYINNDFVQLRFRLESSGSQNYTYTKIGYITDVKIDTGSVGIPVHEPISYLSSFNFTPNPASSYINITTNQNEPYQIAIYDMGGRVIFTQEHVTDGVLNVAHLPKGSYFVVASVKQHRVARKLIIK
jgi:hypothetical protein